VLYTLETVSDARRLTDNLRAGSEQSTPFEKDEALQEGDSALQIVIDGGVLRQRYLTNGRLHTVALYLRNDVLNLGRYMGGKKLAGDHLVALKSTVIGTVPFYAVSAMRNTTTGPLGVGALMCREVGIAYERLITLGQRSALEATAHLFCEIVVRCNDADAGVAAGRGPPPMTQATLSTLLGISTVHIDRTIQDLRLRELADIVDQQLVVHDFDRLAELADFDDSYLRSI
jgi:hypothetical protein